MLGRGERDKEEQNRGRERAEITEKLLRNPEISAPPQTT